MSNVTNAYQRKSKDIPVLNKTSKHEEVSGSGIGAYILDVITRWRRMVNNLFI